MIEARIYEIASQSITVTNRLFLLFRSVCQFQIQLFDERLHPPPTPTDPSVWGSTNLDRHYLIGLGGRGITALEKFGVWDDVQRVAVPVPGRQDWNGKGSNPLLTFKTERKYVTQVLPRDKLVSVLYHHILDAQSNSTEQKEATYDDNTPQAYSNVFLRYGCIVEPVDIDSPDGKVTVKVKKVNKESPPHYLCASIVIAADGSARTFANAMQQHDELRQIKNAFRVERYKDDNQKVFKNIAFRIPNQWRNDINYAVRTNRIIFDALPANSNREYVGVLLMAKDDDMAQPDVDAATFREFLREEIPQFLDMFDDVTFTRLSKRAVSTLPMFRFVTPRMHHGKGRIVLLGDCAHTVKPYFGMGANSALEDVKLLCEVIHKHQSRTNAEEADDLRTLTRAVQDFSAVRTYDIETLVRVSRSLDRPGIQGICTFLIPIILDGIFYKLMPQLFAPNIISMLQNEEITFVEAAERKRLDRMWQLTILILAAISIPRLLS